MNKNNSVGIVKGIELYGDFNFNIKTKSCLQSLHHKNVALLSCKKKKKTKDFI
jgi:hypothetical protein